MQSKWMYTFLMVFLMGTFFVSNVNAQEDLEKRLADLEKRVAELEAVVKPSMPRLRGKVRIEMENELAKLMELELAQKQRFYDSVKGTYEGAIQLPQGKSITLRLVLIPNIPPVLLNLDRIRTHEEIKSDLINLAFNVQIVQQNSWIAFSQGCQIEKVRPDFINGEINIASEHCPSFYKLRLADIDPTHSENNSSLIAKGILDGKIAGDVPILHGELYPMLGSSSYKFTIQRLQPK